MCIILYLEEKKKGLNEFEYIFWIYFEFGFKIYLWKKFLWIKLEKVRGKIGKLKVWEIG